MNREMKFRGLVKSNIAKDIHAKEWVYGWLTKTVHNQMVVMQEDGNHFEKYIVIPESVGQYTGLKDRNGKEIYEGDIIKDWCGIREVKFEYGDNAQGYDIETDDTDLEILGNIYENKNLINE